MELIVSMRSRRWDTFQNESYLFYSNDLILSEMFIEQSYKYH